MFWLILATVSQAGFALSLKGAAKHGARLPAVGVVNYFTAALVFIILWGIDNNFAVPHVAGMAWGALAGGAFVFNYILLQAVLVRVGVGITSGIMRLSVVVPVLGTIVFYGELPDALQWVGLSLVVPSLVLLSGGSGGAAGRRDLSGLALLLALFLNTGFGHFLLKVYRHTPGANDDEAAFGAMLFATAAVAGLFVLHRPGKRTSGLDAGWGVVVGLFNVGGIRFMLYALQEMPAVIAYPLNTVVGLALVSVLASVLFGEVFHRRALAGLLLAAAAGALLNLKVSVPELLARLGWGE